LITPAAEAHASTALLTHATGQIREQFIINARAELLKLAEQRETDPKKWAEAGQTAEMRSLKSTSPPSKVLWRNTLYRMSAECC
jgi:hypothetical protein